MNWKNVAHLIRVDMKSGRLIRGRKLTRYRESRVVTYLLYGGALTLGVIVGALVGVFYNTISPADSELQQVFQQGLPNILLALPTLILIYSLVFTMMQQIQRAGVKFTVQAPYWLPITWEEHTLASILANVLGFILISIIFIGSAIIVVSIFLGQIPLAILTFLALLMSAFMASAITEIFRVLQVRFIGAVYKSTGRAAVWVRFVGTLLFFLVFYIIYFAVTSGPGALIFVQTVASAQSTVWFIPFVWLGMAISSFINRFIVQAIAFMALSILFILSLFFSAVLLNRRFGLYEPPAITVSKGIYAPRTGFLGRLGFSTVEAALIRKDLKAFTRRRELMFIFIAPIVFILIPLMQTIGTTGTEAPVQVSMFLFIIMSVTPGAIMSMSMGNLMIGEEGGAIWRIYSAPISANSLVKSKYFFMVVLSILVALITGIVGLAVFHPSSRAAVVALIESTLLVFALGAVSLSNGVKGADFTELPRPRMMRTGWAIINLIACLLAAIAIFVPFFPYVVTLIPFVTLKPTIDLYQAVIISAIVAVILTSVFYRIAIRNAKELLTKAET